MLSWTMKQNAVCILCGGSPTFTFAFLKGVAREAIKIIIGQSFVSIILRPSVSILQKQSGIMAECLTS